MVSALESPAHHAAINEALQVVHGACVEAQVLGYEELQGSGQLRYLKLDVERSSNKVQLTLVWNAKSLEEATTKAFGDDGVRSRPI